MQNNVIFARVIKLINAKVKGHQMHVLVTGSTL